MSCFVRNLVKNNNNILLKNRLFLSSFKKNNLFFPLINNNNNFESKNKFSKSIKQIQNSQRHPLGWSVDSGDNKLRATTILCVRKNNKVVMIGDGQVSLGSTVVKPNARKVRRIKEDIITGFAGSTADCMTLFERLEQTLEKHSGEERLLRSCVELVQAWRTEKYMRHLEAVMIVADKNYSLTLSGNGDVLEPHIDVVAVGSGGCFAQCAAQALLENTDLDPEIIGKKAMKIAGDTCIYTNTNFIIETIDYSNKNDDNNNNDKDDK